MKWITWVITGVLLGELWVLVLTSPQTTILNIVADGVHTSQLLENSSRKRRRRNLQSPALLSLCGMHQNKSCRSRPATHRAHRTHRISCQSPSARYHDTSTCSFFTPQWFKRCFGVMRTYTTLSRWFQCCGWPACILYILHVIHERN